MKKGEIIISIIVLCIVSLLYLYNKIPLILGDGSVKIMDYSLNNKIQFSTKITKSYSNILKESFTDQVTLIKFNQYLKDNNITDIDKELINFGIFYSQISIYFNHQNGTNVKKLFKDYLYLDGKLQEEKLIFLTKNLDYQSYTMLIYLVGRYEYKQVAQLQKIRKNIYPLEELNARIYVRKKGYNNIDCNILVISDNNQDTIDYLLCNLFNGKFSNNDLIIASKLNNELQNFSDKGNYYNYILSERGFTEKINEQIKIMGEKILEYDKNFINGYLLLMGYYNNISDCQNFKYYYDDLNRNYIGDNINGYPVYLDYYKNCKVK